MIKLYVINIYKRICIMIFEFLKRKKKIKDKKRLLKASFLNLHIPEQQKLLYIQALDIVDEEWLDRLYKLLTNYIENIEIKNLEEIQKTSFSIITGLRRKEAEEKKEEINSFSFLINNI